MKEIGEIQPPDHEYKYQQGGEQADGKRRIGDQYDERSAVERSEGPIYLRESTAISNLEYYATLDVPPRQAPDRARLIWLDRAFLRSGFSYIEAEKQIQE
jgi:hypothetical protein